MIGAAIAFESCQASYSNSRGQASENRSKRESPAPSAINRQSTWRFRRDRKRIGRQITEFRGIRRGGARRLDAHG
jgi:hypothetical protein